MPVARALRRVQSTGPGLSRRVARRHGEYAYADPQVAELRDFLRLNNGIKGLEMVDPLTDPAGYAVRAARLFLRDGFGAQQSFKFNALSSLRI